MKGQVFKSSHMTRDIAHDFLGACLSGSVSQWPFHMEHREAAHYVLQSPSFLKTLLKQPTTCCIYYYEGKGSLNFVSR